MGWRRLETLFSYSLLVGLISESSLVVGKFRCVGGEVCYRESGLVMVRGVNLLFPLLVVLVSTLVELEIRVVYYPAFS